MKCFIYHNMELALEWLESQRAVMYDPEYAGFFLQYTDGEGHGTGKVYNEPRDVREVVQVVRVGEGGEDSEV